MSTKFRALYYQTWPYTERPIAGTLIVKASKNNVLWAVAWLRRLVVDRSPWGTGFISKSVQADKAALRQALSDNFGTSPPSVIPRIIHIHPSNNDDIGQ